MRLFFYLTIIILLFSCKSNANQLFKAIEKSDKLEIDFDWNIIFAQFYNYESEKPTIEFNGHSPEKIREILQKHDFSIERINSGIEKLDKVEEKKKQRGLGDFF